MIHQPADTSHSAGTKSHQYQYIDILRGLAILGVLAVHCQQQVEDLTPLVRAVFIYGQLGVQLLFVASAITLCLSMRARHESVLSNFYVRRFFRIAPAYYFGIAFYFAWRVFLNDIETGTAKPPAEYSVTGIIENLLFIHGFDPRNYNFVVPGGWSIAAEMCFYGIFPWLFQLQSRLGFGKFLRFALLTFSVSFLAQFLIIQFIEPALLTRGLLDKIYPNDQFGFLYSSILNQINVFLIGMLTFQKLGQRDPSGPEVLLAVCLTVISGYLLNTAEFKTGYNGFIFPIFSAIAFSTLALKLSSAGPSDRRLARTLAKIGQVSFSMYLLHFFILDVFKLAFSRAGLSSSTMPEVQLTMMYAALIPSTYLLASISYGAIERPAIAYGKKFIRL